MGCRRPITLAAVVALSGCAVVVERATLSFADDLEAAVLDYDEPSVIASGLPAYLIILEARVEANPENPATRLALARLTGAYAGLFAESDQSRKRLTRRALNHARKGACLKQSILCKGDRQPFEEFEESLAGLGPGDLQAAYVLGTAWAAWIAAFRDDFGALADLPKVEALLKWVAEQDPRHDDGAVWLYLAVLNSQRPPAAGGRPALALEYYQRALEISRNRNLLVKVFMADEYARLMFDRDLYVELLEDVLEADPDQPGYRLTNHVAQDRAREMLDNTHQIFD